jgi:hypothetical protein
MVVAVGASKLVLMAAMPTNEESQSAWCNDIMLEEEASLISIF